MSKLNIIGYTAEQLEQTMAELGHKSFRGRQLYKWLYNVRQYDFGLMSDLAVSLREQLAEKFTVEHLKPVDTAISSDSTMKFLFELPDGKPVETVLIPDAESNRKTVCVSSQVGCALACKFCATGTMGLLRDLTVGEIVGQLMFIRDNYGENGFSNIVFMGMGEPLHNFQNVVEAIRIISDENGMNFPARRITVSTSGITPKIKKLADTGLKARLAISLHAATQEKRVQIMPVAETFKLDKLMDAIKYYIEKTGSRVTFEYILIDGFNDTMQDIKALARLVQGVQCKINVLAYNPVPGLDFKRPSDEKINWFGKQLYPRTPAVTIRKSRGDDIAAACGQLAARKLTENL